MLGLRCIVGNLHGGGRLLRSLPHVQKSCVSSSSLTSQRVSLHRGLPPPLRGVSCLRIAKEQKLRQQRLQQLQQVALGQGNFSLLDHTGSRTKRDFLGSWALLYFGFTHCPDICPDELDKLSAWCPLWTGRRAASRPAALHHRGPREGRRAALARYVKDFHPRLVGLTGTPEEVKEAGRDYRVYAAPDPRTRTGTTSWTTILIYLVSPDGLFLDYYNRMKNQDQIAESVRNHIRNHVPLADT
uniref:Synthesis of cytochrome C oxidase 2 n=1 Tax=Labrus bergylta TaxID=56723 RepID=A0A3Q3LHQ3_9LABR